MEIKTEDEIKQENTEESKKEQEVHSVIPKIGWINFPIIMKASDLDPNAPNDIFILTINNMQMQVSKEIVENIYKSARRALNKQF